MRLSWLPPPTATILPRYPQDRAALAIVEAAERDGLLRPGGTIVEATGGNTGIGLALVAAAKGYKTIFTMPASVAQEKQDMMRNAGARVLLTEGAPFSDPAHYFHVAAKLAHHNEIQVSDGRCCGGYPPPLCFAADDMPLRSATDATDRTHRRPHPLCSHAAPRDRL